MVAVLNDSMKKYVDAMRNSKTNGTQSQSTPSTSQQNYTNVMTNNSPTRTNQTLNTMNNLSNQSYTFTKPKEFTYDQNSDPAYQAALASARQNITQQQADTNAQLRAGGQGKSSWSDSVANQIGAKEMAKVSTDVLPQLISQAYQRYVDDANRDLSIQQANYGVTQDRISNLSTLYGLQNNEDFTNPMAEAQLTGQYLSGEARQYINAINNLKAQAETKGVTAAARSELSSQADQYRQALQGLGIDSSLFGANVNRANSVANTGKAGVQTLDAQQLSYQKERDAVADQQWQQNFGVTLAQVTGYMPDGTPTSNQQQLELSNLWTVADQTGTIPDSLATMYGLPKGTQTRSAKEFAAQLAIQQQNANSSSTSAAASYMNAMTNRQQENRISTSGSSSGSSSSGTKSTSSTSGKVGSKDSANSLVEFKSVITDNKRQGLTQSQAMSYLQGVSDYLSDSDYNKAIKYIEDSYKDKE